MKRHLLTLTVLLILVVFVAGCAQKTQQPAKTLPIVPVVNTTEPVIPEPVPTEPIFNTTEPAPPEPVPAILMKGDRILGIHITTAQDNDFSKAFDVAKNAGMQSTSLLLTWSSIETTPMNYSNPFLSIANAYYPAAGTSISLVIAPINTNRNEVPADLANKPLDDPAVMDRFNKMMDYVFSQIPDLQLSSLAIGNEVDIYLGTDDAKWREYKAFYDAARAYIKTKRNVDVGVVTTAEGLATKAKDRINALNENSDIIMLTYYPLNADFTVKDPFVVETDFNEFTALYKKPLYITEAGYPSGTTLGSSEAKQKEFIENVFEGCDSHPQIKYIAFLNLHEWTQAQVDDLAGYYGLSDVKFKEYLRTLGLRTPDGTDKPAFEALKSQAKARGW